jgi:hypothetical protein
MDEAVLRNSSKIVRDKTFRHAHPHEDPAADPIELLGLIRALA